MCVCIHVYITHVKSSSYSITNLGQGGLFRSQLSYRLVKVKKKGKAIPLHAMEALRGRGGIASTHSRPRH
jgi:hypothetical protein